MAEMASSQRRLLIQFDLYLRFVHNVVNQARFTGSIGYRVPYAIFVSLLNRARAVSALFATGYVQEADPIVRAMINAAVNFLYLVTRADPDAFALMYFLHLEDVAVFRATEMEKEGILDTETAERMRQEARDAAAPHRDAANAAGMQVPPKPGGKRDTWTGLSDQQLMAEVHAERWYAIYYRYFSSAVHADASTIGEDIQALALGVASVGPRYRDPLGAIRVSVEVLHGALLGFHRRFKVGQLRDLDQAKTLIDEAIADYIRASGILDG